MSVINRMLVSGWLNNTPAPLSIWGSNVMRWIEIPKEIPLADGTLMDQITDWSGHGRHLTASGANRGTYKTNIINGLPVFRTAGSQSYASINGKPDDDFKHQGDSTFITLIRSNVDSSSHTLFDSGLQVATDIGVFEQFRSSGSFQTRIGNGSGTYVTELTLQPANDGNPTPKDQWLLIVTRMDSTKSIEHLTIERDNILKGTYTMVGSYSASTSSQVPLWFSNYGTPAKLNADIVLRVELNIAATDEELNRYLGSNLTLGQ